MTRLVILSGVCDAAMLAMGLDLVAPLGVAASGVRDAAGVALVVFFVGSMDGIQAFDSGAPRPSLRNGLLSASPRLDRALDAVDKTLGGVGRYGTCPRKGPRLPWALGWLAIRPARITSMPDRYPAPNRSHPVY